VHGIGAQRAGSLTKTWAQPIRQEIDQILREQGRGLRDAEGLHFVEYVWDAQVRAFSGLAVTSWTLMNLPRIAAIHTALSFEARPESQYTEKPKQIASQNVVRFWISMWRGLLAPVLVVGLIVPLWIINPPVVIATGTLSLLRPSSWRPLRLRWRPIRPANFVMARVIGDAYMWLTSPIGRLLSRGSRENLIEGITSKLEELYKEHSRVVIVAHSQGAAIAVAALEAQGVPRRPTHLVTVGGGHRLLQGIYASKQAVDNSMLSVFYLGIGTAVLVQVLWFQWMYIGSLVYWFLLTPLWALMGFTTAVARVDDAASVEPGWLALLFGLTARLIEAANLLALSLMILCVIAVVCALHAFGRPRTPTLQLRCGWTEVWSRFDPVCTGPAISVSVPKTGSVVSLRRSRSPYAAETWILRSGLPLLEHTSYFSPNSSSLRVIAMSIVWQLNSYPVRVTLPGSPRIIRRGLAWIAWMKMLVAIALLFSALIAAGIVCLIFRSA
jgi:hypothetical protein